MSNSQDSETSKDVFYFGQLEDKHVEEAAGVCARSFLQLNKIWKSYDPAYTAMISFMTDKINSALEAEKLVKDKLEGTFINFVYTRNGVVIGVVLMYELDYFLTKPYKEGKLPLFNKLELAGKQLEKNLVVQKYKGSKNLYTIFGAIEGNLARQGISENFWGKIAEHTYNHGFKYMVARYSSINSYNLIMKFGATHVGRIVVEDEGKNFQLTMAQLDISKAIKNMKEGLKRRSNRIQSQPKPKL